MMRRLLLGLVCCGGLACSEPTSVELDISGPPLQSLTLTATVGASGPFVRALPSQGAQPTLPGVAVLIVPDVAQPVKVALQGLAASGAQYQTSDSVASVPHSRVQLALTLGGPAQDMALSSDLRNSDLRSAGDLPDLGPTVLGQDTFQRLDNAGWGVASDGQTWDGDSPWPNFSIVSNAGVIQNYGNAVLGPVVADAEVLSSQSVSAAQMDFDAGPIVRWTSSDNFYKAEYDAATGNFVLTKHVDGAVGTLASTPFGVPLGTRYWIRLRVRGNELQAKIWINGMSEPPGWTFGNYDDNLTSGRCGLRAATAQNGIKATFYYFSAVGL
jgi:hypothetical protein